MRLFLLLSLFLMYPLLASENGHAVLIEGSSTVYPITVAVTERISQENPQLISSVVCSGSSAGLRRLIAGEIPIAEASRPINHEEMAVAASHGIDFIELPIALDAITFVVNTKNTFVTSLTVEELRRLWQPDSKITTWAQVRQGWPEAPIELYSMGKDSGTFDFMTEAIVGKARAIRADLAWSSQDPQQLIQGIVTHDQAIGYFGHAYFRQNAAMLRAIPVDDGRGPVMPSTESITNRTYRPLSRPIFIYVNRSDLDKRPEVSTLVQSYLRLAPLIVTQVGYVPLTEKSYDLVRQRLANRVIGSTFSTARPEDRLDDLLATSIAAQAGKSPVMLPSPAEPSPATLASASTSPHAALPPNAPASGPAIPVAARPAPAESRTTSTANAWLPAYRTTGDTAPAAGAQAPDAIAVLDSLRRSCLELARLALDDGSLVGDLERHEKDIRSALDRLAYYQHEASLPAGRAATLGDLTASANSSHGIGIDYPMVIARLDYADAVRDRGDTAILDAFKHAALGITDPEQRHHLESALMNPSTANIARFTEAIAGLGLAHGEANLILCYARGGLVIR